MDAFDDLSKQEKIEYASFGSGGIIIILALIIFFTGMQGIGGALVFAGLGVAFVPYGVYTYLQTKKVQSMEREFPGFLRNLSESRKSGMSIPKAFQNAANTNYGRLDDDVRKAADQLSWGIPFPEVMDRFKKRMGPSSLIKRSISIIMQSYEAGGDISETMDAIAQDASKIKDAESERKAVLQQQVLIIYAIYFLFVGILLALYYILVPLLDIGGGGFIGSPPNFCQQGASALCSMCPVFGLDPDPNAKLCYYKVLFLLMLMVEGVFNGLVAGEIGSGKVSAGLKHIMLMAPAGFIIYVGVLSLLG